jgi:hypothetical protein
MAIACGFILASASAQAVEPWETPFMSTQKQSAMVWKEMRDCARGAAQRAQDHTPEGNKKREETRLNCLRLHHLPVDPQPSRNYSPPS